MSNQTILACEAREEFGKGFARRARVAGRVPAVLYGHGQEPVHITLPGHETMLALKHKNALLKLEWDGNSELAIAKDIQIHVVKRNILHVDLLLVRKGEKITVNVPVHLTGESYPGTIHVLETTDLSIDAEATNLPESVEVSVEGLEDGAKIFAGDIALPEGSVLAGDPEQMIVLITTPRVASEDDENEDSGVEGVEVLEEAASEEEAGE